MSARGIGLMVLGALGTAALIGLDGHVVAATTLMVMAGLGTLTAFALGSLALVRGRGDCAEVVRVDGFADGVEQEARGAPAPGLGGGPPASDRGPRAPAR